HLAGEDFKLKADINLIHVPYKGTSPAITDTLGGHIEIAFVAVGDIASGGPASALRPLAILGEARDASLPDVPTTAESGYPGLIAGSWMGVLAPAGISKENADWLSDHIALAAQSRQFQQKAGTFGITGKIMNGPETTAFMIRKSAQFKD